MTFVICFLTGGMDGCLNREVDENSGFAGPGNFMNIVGVLDNMYDSTYAECGLSRADFYVLAGEVALENAFAEAQRDEENCDSQESCIELFNDMVSHRLTLLIIKHTFTFLRLIWASNMEELTALPPLLPMLKETFLKATSTWKRCANTH